MQSLIQMLKELLERKLPTEELDLYGFSEIVFEG